MLNYAGELGEAGKVGKQLYSYFVVVGDPTKPGLTKPGNSDIGLVI